MTGTQKPTPSQGMENVSLNSSRRSGEREDGLGNPAHRTSGHDTNASAKTPDQQIPSDGRKRKNDAPAP